MFSIIILSIIQGITEFLPISSSAHLIVFRNLFLVGDSFISNDIELLFDISLHFGTLLAIMVYFFNDFLNMFKYVKKDNDEYGNVFLLIVVSTIPTVIIGLLFDDFIESIVRNNYLIIALSLIIMGIILYIIDIHSKQLKKIKDIKIIDAFIIGCSQVFALIPGFSRSGTTIAMARLLKIDRKDSAKFSLYLSVPVIFGAIILQLFKVNISIIISNYKVFLLGIIVSFVVGLLSIKYLLNYLQKKDFKIFMWYRLLFGLIIILLLIIKPI